MVWKISAAFKSPFGKKRTALAEFLGVDTVDFKLVSPASCAHVIIDVQKEFCDPFHGMRGTFRTHRKASKIARIKPAFARAGVRTVVVYFGEEHEGLEEACGGFHKITIDENDILVKKNRDSAFEGSNIEEILKQHGIDTLFISGFNARACVRSTVLDGLQRHFNIALMADCIGQDKLYIPMFPMWHEERVCIREMVEAGACETTSETVLGLLQPAA